MIRIGTRDSALAVWQAKLVKDLLGKQGLPAELVYIKTEGDQDGVTPLYAMGVEGIFTRTLDSALLSGSIDVAVHSMKDVPVQLAAGILQAAVLERGSYLDIFVPKDDAGFLEDNLSTATIATCSIRRRAQWLRRYPNHTIESIRGNVDTRLQKVYGSHWQGAIFAAAGLERIGLRPANAIDLHWMLPAPAQGAILVVCREGDSTMLNACKPLIHEETAVCVQMERDFLHRLMGGCTAPISALATCKGNMVHLRGQVLSTDGRQLLEAAEFVSLKSTPGAGFKLADQLIANGADTLIRHMKENVHA
jgi:hydroxymethylbilane synthase